MPEHTHAARPSVLVAEDERSMREFLQILLHRHQYEVDIVADGQLACSRLDDREFDIVITDLKMPGADGLAVLKHTKARYPATEVLMLTAFSTTETAIEAMKVGAYDYLTKPFKVDELLLILERAIEKRRLVQDNEVLRRELSDRYRLNNLYGRSPVMQQLFALVRRVANTKTSVLITGESGTGKELVARAIHALSDRRDHDFIPVNCGAIPDTLMESELFGHVRGAFTGATTDRAGLFSAADGGTIFLDEIGELSTPMQVKLLRALQERKIKPVGDTAEKPVDVRILAASNRNLVDDVASGRFRSDLFYRLNVIPVSLPPLRERTQDIPMLIQHFIHKFSAQLGRPAPAISSQAVSVLCKYAFPGNVRELENLMERAVTLTTGTEIGISALPELQTLDWSGTSTSGDTRIPEEGIDLDAHIGAIEQRLLSQALEQTKGNRTEAARMLQISLRSLRYRLAKHGLGSESDGD